MSAETRPDGTGVIHDIGYQHYTGPRAGRGAIRLALLSDSARGAYGLGRSTRSKVMPLLLLAAMCLPAIILVVVTAVTRQDELVSGYSNYLLNLQMVIAIYVASQAPASVSRDLRFGVMSLYLSRPLERIDYVAAKYGALTLAVFVFVALPLTILFVGGLVAGLAFTEQLPGYLRALTGAGIAAAVLAGIGLVIASVTPRRGIGVAAVIAVLLVLVGVQGAAQQIALDASADTAAGYLGALSPFTLVHGIEASLLGGESGMFAQPPGATGGLVFLAIAIAIVGGCFAALLLRYRKVSVS